MNLSEFNSDNSAWNHQKTHGFQMISGEIEVNSFALIREILEMKFCDEPSGKLA